VAGTQATISFADDGVAGSSGCNTFTGLATWGDGDLSIDPNALASTMMACDGPIMDQEALLLSTLVEADEYRVDGDELQLLDGGSVVARFSATAS
jgi:heat shock protein HslJ